MSSMSEDDGQLSVLNTQRIHLNVRAKVCTIATVTHGLRLAVQPRYRHPGRFELF